MRVIDYPAVLRQAEADGLRCVYPNSGAFAPFDQWHVVGWLGPADSTIRPDLPARLIHCPPPYPLNLAERAIAQWLSDSAGLAWVLPKSHWTYELQHAQQDWLTARLAEFGIDVAMLAAEPTAAAIEFGRDEAIPLRRLLIDLFCGLKASDYTMLLPGSQTIVTIHHHQQLWWQTADLEMSRHVAEPWPAF